MKGLRYEDASARKRLEREGLNPWLARWCVLAGPNRSGLVLLANEGNGAKLRRKAWQIRRDWRPRTKGAKA